MYSVPVIVYCILVVVCPEEIESPDRTLPRQPNIHHTLKGLGREGREESQGAQRQPGSHGCHRQKFSVSQNQVVLHSSKEAPREGRGTDGDSGVSETGIITRALSDSLYWSTSNMPSAV